MQDREIRQALADIKEELGNINARIEQLEKNPAGTSADTEALTRVADVANKRIDEVSDRLAKLQTGYDNLTTILEQIGEGDDEDPASPVEGEKNPLFAYGADTAGDETTAATGTPAAAAPGTNNDSSAQG